MLPSVSCCYQDKNVPFFWLSTLIWLILLTWQRGNKILMASLSPQTRSELVCVCTCEVGWGAGPGMAENLQSSWSYGLCFAQPGIINVSSWLLTASRRYLWNRPKWNDLWRQVHLVIFLCSQYQSLLCQLSLLKPKRSPSSSKCRQKQPLDICTIMFGLVKETTFANRKREGNF